MRQYFVQPTAATPACTASVSAHLSICLSVSCLPVYPSIQLPVCLSICLSLRLSVHHVVCFTALLFTQLFHCCNCCCCCCLCCNCCLILLTSISINCRQSKQRGLCVVYPPSPPLFNSLYSLCLGRHFNRWRCIISQHTTSNLAKYHRTLCSQSVVNF